jgi:hypothetical protein
MDQYQMIDLAVVIVLVLVATWIFLEMTTTSPEPHTPPVTGAAYELTLRTNGSLRLGQRRLPSLSSSRTRATRNMDAPHTVRAA